MFKHQIDHICHQWHTECLQSNTSAGFVAEVSGGDGTGKGTLSPVAVGLGPFIYTMSGHVIKQFLVQVS